MTTSDEKLIFERVARAAHAVAKAHQVVHETIHQQAGAHAEHRTREHARRAANREVAEGGKPPD